MHNRYFSWADVACIAFICVTVLVGLALPSIVSALAYTIKSSYVCNSTTQTKGE